MSGYGNVAGAFVTGLMAANKENRQEELAEQKSAELEQRAVYQSKQMEMIDMNIKKAERVEAQQNTLQAKQLKSAQAGVLLAEANAKMKTYTDMAGGELSQVKNQLTQVTNQLEDKVVVDKTSTLHTKLMQTHAEGGSLKTKDVLQLNQMVAENPVMTTVVKGTLSLYNPLDETHQQALEKATQKFMVLAGANSKKPPTEREVGMTRVMVKDMVKRGIFLFDDGVDELVPIKGLFALTNVTGEVAQTTVDKAGESIQASGKAALDTWSKEQELPGFDKQPAWKDPQAPQNQKKLYKGQDPKRIIDSYTIAGMKDMIPAEAQAAYDANKELVKTQAARGYFSGATQGELHSTLNDITEQALGGNMSKESIAILQAGIGEVKDTELKKQYTKSLKIAKNGLAIGNIYEDASKVAKPEQRLAYIEEDNLKGNSALQKESDLVNGSKTLVRDIDLTVQEIITATNEGGDGLMTGWGAGALVKGAATDPGVVDKVVDIIAGAKKIVDPDTGEERYKLNEKAILSSININTRVGALIAKYVKSTSGAGVSDQEREFLTRIIVASNNGDPKAMVTAMESFRNIHIEGLQEGRNHLVKRNALPYSYYGVDKLDAGSKVNQVGTNYTKTSDLGSRKPAPAIPPAVPDTNASAQVNYAPGSREDPKMKRAYELADMED